MKQKNKNWLFGFAMLAAFDSFSYPEKQWAFCDSNELAWSAWDSASNVYSDRKPTGDDVCKLKIWQKTLNPGDNRTRCEKGDKINCKVGAGGDLSVPFSLDEDQRLGRDSWYMNYNMNPLVPADEKMIRCQCGCFTGDVSLLTTSGYQPVAIMSADATKRGGIQAITFDHTGRKLRPTKRLLNSDFVVGPEKKLVYRIETDNERSVTLTEVHPVLIVTKGRKRMVEAQTLTIGDTLLNEDGSATKVTEITSFKLPADHNLVYNFDTEGSSAMGHVVVANGLRVGDLNWQTRLSERSERQRILWEAAKN